MGKKNSLKIALIVLVIILLIILLWLYFIKPSNNNGTNNISSYAEQNISNNTSTIMAHTNVSMTIKENTLTRNGATLVITGNNETPYGYGDYYKIEKREGNNWISAPTVTEILEFNSSYDYMPNGNTLEFPIDWTKYYGTLENGQYRIVKDVGYNGIHYIYAEFIIE